MFIVCPKCGAKYQIPSEISLNEGRKVQCSACQHTFPFKKENEISQNESVEKNIYLSDEPLLKETEVIVKTEKIVTQTQLPEAFHPLTPVMPRQSSSWMWSIILAIVLIFLIVVFWLYRDALSSNINPNHIQTNRIFYSSNKQNEIQKTIKSNKNKSIIDEEKRQIEIPVFSIDSNFDKHEIKNPDAEIITPPVESPFSFHSIHFRMQTVNNERQLLIEGKIRNDSDLPQILPNVVYATAYDSKGTTLFQKEIYFSKEVLPANMEKSFYGTYAPAPDGVQWMEVTCKK